MCTCRTTSGLHRNLLIDKHFVRPNIKKYKKKFKKNLALGMYNANLEQSGIHPNVEHAKKGGEGVVIYIWKLKNGDIIPTVNTPR